MDETSILPDQTDRSAKQDQIGLMFNRISRNYDLLNRVITFGFYNVWQRHIVGIVQKTNPKKILDVATGTGDLAIRLAKTNSAKIIGVDISTGMIAIGHKKIQKKRLSDKIELKKGDCENLEFPTGNFDVVTVSFGLRNFENLTKGVSEIYRVMKPDGIFVALETSRPNSNFIKFFYNLYARIIMPILSGLLGSNKYAYKYLFDSTQVFHDTRGLMNILRVAGFKNVHSKRLTFGVATIYEGRKGSNPE